MIKKISYGIIVSSMLLFLSFVGYSFYTINHAYRTITYTITSVYDSGQSFISFPSNIKGEIADKYTKIKNKFLPNE